MAAGGKERLYEDLKRRILTLELEPGSALDETSLSADYGVSRTPLRDVFRRLHGEGYLLLRDNRGAVVSPMSHRTLREFFRTAPLIYANVARLAAENRTDSQLDDLRAAQAGFKDAVARTAVEEMVTGNDRFHWIMGEMADNPYLMPSLQRLLIDHARIGRTFWDARSDDMQVRIVTASDQHDRFIDLLQARDADAAVALTLDHWALSREHAELYVRPDPLPLDVGS